MVVPAKKIPQENRDVRFMKPKELRQHPLQNQVYFPCSSADDRNLEKDIAAFGIQVPIDVMPAKNKAGLPAHTMTDGHRRREIAMKLHLAVVPVRVRDDLADMTRAEIFAWFLRQGMDRRNLDPVEKVSLAFKHYCVISGKRLEDLDYRDPAAKQYVAEYLGQNVRNISRHARLLSAPSDIQAAVKRGDLPLTVGERVADLPPEDQQALVKTIKSASEPKKVLALVRGALPEKKTTPARAARVAGRLLRSVVDHLNQLNEKASDLPASMLSAQLTSLEQVAAMLASLISRAHGKKVAIKAAKISLKKVPEEIVPAEDIDVQGPQYAFPDEFLAE